MFLHCVTCDHFFAFGHVFFMDFCSTSPNNHMSMKSNCTEHEHKKKKGAHMVHQGGKLGPILDILFQYVQQLHQLVCWDLEKQRPLFRPA